MKYYMVGHYRVPLTPSVEPTSHAGEDAECPGCWTALEPGEALYPIEGEPDQCAGCRSWEERT